MPRARGRTRNAWGEKVCFLSKDSSSHLNIFFQLVQVFGLSLFPSPHTCQTGDIHIKNIQILPLRYFLMSMPSPSSPFSYSIIQQFP